MKAMAKLAKAPKAVIFLSWSTNHIAPPTIVEAAIAIPILIGSDFSGSISFLASSTLSSFYFTYLSSI